MCFDHFENSSSLSWKGPAQTDSSEFNTMVFYSEKRANYLIHQKL